MLMTQKLRDRSTLRPPNLDPFSKKLAKKTRSFCFTRVGIARPRLYYARWKQLAGRPYGPRGGCALNTATAYCRISCLRLAQSAQLLCKTRHICRGEISLCSVLGVID